uniref:CCHC-type domain-containing protein n=1 Tax=Tanacetum cinerariifolium TaxID=118510 RepID=A0A6L2K0R6_TANCI|nr:hypothetical protein [Tanacetum cinerariifolium]
MLAYHESFANKQCVGFKRLHGVTTTQLVLLVYKVTVVFNKVNVAKSRVIIAVRVSTARWIKWLEDQDMQLVLLVYEVAAVFNKVNAAKSRVTTAVRVSTAGWIKWLEEKDMRDKELKIYSLGSTSGIRASGEYDLWLMRIEQYFLMTDYSIWEVIKNGNKVLTKTVGTVEHPYKPTTIKEKLDRKNEMKARGTLLMALLNKDQLKFHSYQDAKLLMEVIEKRLQKLFSHLDIQGKVIEQEDINLKLLKSLSSKWKTHALIWRNKAEIETISLDDLYNNLKYMLNLQDHQAQVKIYKMSKVECFNCHKNEHFTRECRALRNQENRGREYGRKTVPVENPTKNALITQDEIGGYDWSYQAEEEHPINFALMALTSSGSSSNSDSKNLEKTEKERDELKLTLEKYQNLSKSLNTVLKSQVSDKDKTGLGYKVASPEIENFVNSSKMIENQENVSVVKTVKSKVEFVDVKNKGVCSTVETKTVRKYNFSPPIIED